MHSDTDIKLNILLIESNLSSRSHIKRILKQSGCSKITVEKNGASLISKPQLLNYDLMILDFDIDSSFTGTEFIRQLIALQILQDHTRIIFITDQVEKVAADLPFRYVTTDIIEKPVNNSKLAQKLQYYDNSSKRLKLLLKQLTKADKIQKQNILQHAQFIGLDNQQENEINLIKSTNFLKCGLTNHALNTLKLINDARVQASAQIALYNLCGNETKFKLTLLKMKSLNLLNRKQVFYQISQAIRQSDSYQALSLINQLDEFSYSHQEVELKAFLILECHSIEHCIEYLNQKLGTTLENQHYRNLVSFSLLKCLILEQTLNHKSNEISDELFEVRCKKAWAEIAKNQSPIDMMQYQTYLKLILNICQKPNHKEKWLVRLNILLKQPQDHIKQFILMSASALLKQQKPISLLYNQQLPVLGMMDISAQSLSFNYSMAKIFNDQFRDPELKSALYNRWGIDRQKKNKSFQALTYFSKAHALMPLNSVYLLNFLNIMQSLDIQKYWQFSQLDLIAHANSIELNSQQNQRLEQLSASIVNH
ncbi:response regulator [Pseudoalteromonas denitrificans]|uniref:CheY chemotaxis protein or a CheY-like REC (Receiver) domain n=1 Tax=Pseudoalteromonas denitrificans DSM 6059 TaxID=1123010 RepID=A0A1I1NZE3_9GAMM|nr:response regulator [Pseudoalteromonas denitrificans]SFD02927.1 CheY chemotaxis protein or a CheY-like REC (receiver) domain [Pseudoalteromonas denitrificans DSM 6059]